MQNQSSADVSGKSLSPDHPLHNPAQDRLGYASFGRHLAESIRYLAPNEGLVLGLYGAWGSGKTTLLNFVEHYLESIETPPTVVHFNPWWYSGHESMTREFLLQLLRELKSAKVQMDAAIKALSALITIVSIAPSVISAKELAKDLKKMQTSERSVLEIKKIVSEELNRTQRQIVVIVDDIDRSTAEEIRQLFRTIKGLADFPYVTYILAMDKAIVVKALRSVQEGDGEEYLEKIVQAHFELPSPDPTSLRKMLIEQILDVMNESVADFSDQSVLQHFLNVRDKVEYYMQTPRDVTRLSNSLAVTYPLVRNEVNPSDFWAIETIRIFEPQLYHIMRRNPIFFAEQASPNDNDVLRAFHERWLADYTVDGRKHIEDFIVTLFPNLGWIFNRPYRNTDHEGIRYRRISRPEIFPTYFRFTVPEGEVSVAELGTILDVCSDDRLLADKLIELAKTRHPGNGYSLVDSYLQRLESYVGQDVSGEKAQCLARVLLLRGDHLSESGDVSDNIFEQNTLWSVLRLLVSLIKSLGDHEREALQMSIEESDSLMTMVRLVALLGESVPDIDRWRRIAVNKMRQSANEGHLIKMTQLPMFLWYWQEWGDSDEVRSWLRVVTESNENFLHVVATTRRERSTFDEFGHQMNISYEIGFEALEKFFERKELILRARIF